MASASKTPNLNLPQWVGTEKPERTDFNAAFDEIDTTVASHLAESATDDVHDLVSDGKIIQESGAGSNGRYVRFADGTQICYHTIDYGDIAMTAPYGGFFRPYNNLNWVYQAGFVDAPCVFISGNSDASLGYVDSASSSAITWRPLRHTADTVNVTARLTAIGRWK